MNLTTNENGNNIAIINIKVEWADYDSALSNNGGSYFQPSVLITTDKLEFVFEDSSCGELSTEISLHAKATGSDNWEILYRYRKDNLCDCEDYYPSSLGSQYVSEADIDRVMQLAGSVIRFV